MISFFSQRGIGICWMWVRSKDQSKKGMTLAGTDYSFTDGV